MPTARSRSPSASQSPQARLRTGSASGEDQASAGAPYLADKIRDLHVTSDVSFWNLDGSLHALGHLGGDAVAPLLDELAERLARRGEKIKATAAEDAAELFRRVASLLADEVGGRVTVRLDRVPLGEALVTIARAAGLELETDRCVTTVH